jgi:hypothetical protein
MRFKIGSDAKLLTHGRTYVYRENLTSMADYGLNNIVQMVRRDDFRKALNSCPKSLAVDTTLV